MYKGDLIPKGIMRQEAEYYIIRQSMPYPLADNNVYLIETSDGWAVIDVGVNLESTCDVWELAVKEVGIPFKHINSIYITHCHPDHLGAARWLQKKCEAPVFMLPEEIDRAREYIFLDDDFENTYQQAIHREVTVNMFPQRWQDELVKDWHLEVAPLYPEPAEVSPIYAGDKIDLRGDKFQVMRAPGHSDGQFILWCPERSFLFGADVLVKNSYLHFTDWPNTHLINPLAELFSLMDSLAVLGDVKVFPGHGPTFDDPGTILKYLRRRHLKAMDKVEQAVLSPVSVGEIYSQMYELPDEVHGHRLIMGETLGYLKYLVSQGRLESWLEHGHLLFAPKPRP